MTVEHLNVSNGPLVGNGASTIFPFTFEAASINEVEVELNGVIVSRSLYIVTLNDDFTGSVTFLLPPIGEVYIFAAPDFTQEVNFEDQGPFFQSDVNEPIDRSAKRDLFLLDAIKRSVRVPRGEMLSELPRAAYRASKVLGFTAMGALALFDPNIQVIDPVAIERLMPYDVASEPKLAGETDDNGKMARATAKVTNPFDAKNYRRKLFFAPGAGSGIVDPSAPTTDPVTGIAMEAKRLPQAGDWLIDDFASYTPEGAGKVDGSLKANISIVGVPGQTRFRKSQNKHYFLFAYKGGTGTVSVPNEQYHTLPNINISGITFVEENWRYGFFESFACISAHAVDNLVIEYCEFLNYRGDAIYLGASDKGDGTENRHNRNVTIRFNLFDGYNMNNRNPISVQDWDGLYIYGNRATKCCKPGGGGTVPFDMMNASSGLQMPAAFVDFEPNIEVMNPIGRSAFIFNNVVVDGGGDGVNVFPRSNAGIPNPQVGFSIYDNSFNLCRSGLAVFADENGVVPYNIRFFRNEVRKTRRPFQILRSLGLYIEDNIFDECVGYGDAGYEYTPGNFLPMARSSIRRNTFRKIGNDGAGAFVVNASLALGITENTFDDNSVAGFIYRGGGTNDLLAVGANTFIPSARQTLAIGAVNAGGQTPKFVFARCIEYDNVYNGLANFGFVVEGSAVVRPPAGLLANQGQRLKGLAPPRGEAMDFYCVKGAVGTGDDTPGNAAAVWGPIPAPMGIPNAAGYDIAGTTFGGVVVSPGGSRYTSTTNAGGIGKGTAGYAASPAQAITFQAPSRQYQNVFIGFTANPNSAGALTLADMKFGLWMQGGIVRPIKDGVPQTVTPGAPDPSAAATGIFINQTLRISFTHADGSGRLFMTNPDTGVETQIFSQPVNTGSSNPVYVMVLIGSGDKGASVGISGVAPG